MVGTEREGGRLAGGGVAGEVDSMDKEEEIQEAELGDWTEWVGLEVGGLGGVSRRRGLQGGGLGVRNRVSCVGQKSIGVGMSRERLGPKARPQDSVSDTAEKVGGKGRGWEGVCCTFHPSSWPSKSWSLVPSLSRK